MALHPDLVCDPYTPERYYRCLEHIKAIYASTTLFNLTSTSADIFVFPLAVSFRAATFVLFQHQFFDRDHISFLLPLLVYSSKTISLSFLLLSASVEQSFAEKIFLHHEGLYFCLSCLLFGLPASYCYCALSHDAGHSPAPRMHMLT